MNDKMLKVNVIFNYWRLIPAYFIFCHNKFKDKLNEDLQEWMKVNHQCKRFKAFCYFMMKYKEFRNVFLNRLHRNPFKYVFIYSLFRPLDSLYIDTAPENIGGGFYVQHGFSTVIAAKSIGRHFHVNQQVTIGFKGSECPIIGNDCVVCAGAIVVGG